MLKYLLVILAVSLGSYFYVEAHLPCQQPILYTINTFDVRFGMSKEEFLGAIKEAEGIWEKNVGKDLFALDPKGNLSMNLIYDDRQATTEKNKILQSNANQTKETAASVRADYIVLEQRFKTLNTAYESGLRQFEKDQTAYTTSVEYWNKQGGAPSAEFEKLKRERARLDSVASSLEAKRKPINDLAAEINAKIKIYNSLVDVTNTKIRTLNQSAGKEFNEGEYVSDAKGRRINIYEFTSHDELVRVLAHELGHALGLDHNDNPDSIMYYLNQSTNKALTVEDVAGLSALCKLQ